MNLLLSVALQIALVTPSDSVIAAAHRAVETLADTAAMRAAGFRPVSEIGLSGRLAMQQLPTSTELPDVRAQPRIRWTEPPAEWPQAIRDSIRFGYLDVPVDHAEPDGPVMRMALALLPARTPHPAPDPVVSIAGGPGLPALDYHMRVRAGGPHPLDIVRERRDLIVIDARGHGYSDPARCHELDGAEPITERSAAAERLWLARLEECRARMVAQGVRLETLSSAQVAHDLELLRRALGAPQLNLIGLSYGTRIAAEPVRQVPSAVRAVHYYGPVPADQPLRRRDNTNEALEALFDRCAAVPECRSAYPDLRADYDSILSRLRRAPLRLHLTASDALPDGELVLDAEMMEEGFGDLLRTRELAAGAPLLIHTLAEEGLELLRHMAGPLMSALGDPGVAATTFLAFWCNDGRRGSESLPHRCRALLGDAWEERPADPVQSDVPGLIITGELDPRTPPSYARALAAGLPRAHLVIEPWYGHERPSDCTMRMVGDFFDRPGLAPETACLDSIAPIRFVAGVVPSRWTANLFTRAWRQPWLVGSTAAIGLLMLLLSGIGLAVREVRVRRGARPRGDRIVSVALLVVVAVGLTLLIGLTAALFAGMRRHFFVPLVGLPAEWAWLTTLPWLLLAATAVAAVLALRRRPRRDGERADPLTWSPIFAATLVLALWSVNLG
jgi:pimeloyl-ACP methyl ester carboxylesterase